jgi:hypothetical protein
MNGWDICNVRRLAFRDGIKGVNRGVCLVISWKHEHEDNASDAILNAVEELSGCDLKA